MFCTIVCARPRRAVSVSRIPTPDGFDEFFFRSLVRPKKTDGLRSFLIVEQLARKLNELGIKLVRELRIGRILLTFYAAFVAIESEILYESEHTRTIETLP